MSVSILEALYNAQLNLLGGAKGSPIAHMMGKEQLNNAIELLSLGYPASTKVEPLLEQYGSVENVPEYTPTGETK